MNDDLPEQLRSHRQLHTASCAVSGFECIAKLHKFISPSQFPLQSDPANQGMGFADTSFLKSYGLLAEDAHLARDAALDRIESETTAGRFPLVSLIARLPSGELGWHIMICVRHDADLLLIDPAYPKIQARNRVGLSAEFQRTLDAVPDRQRLHVLTYAWK